VLRLLVTLGAAAIAFTPLPRATVERVYARGLYPILQPRLTTLTNLTPFAWLDILLVLVVVALVTMWVARLRQRRSGILPAAGRMALDTALVASVLYFWFLAAWGLNYQRDPLLAQLDFQEDRINGDALRAFARRNVESLNALHDVAHAGGWPEMHAMPGVLAPAFRRAQQDLETGWLAVPGVPKRSLLNGYFTRVSIDGMTDPFFLETLTNQSLLPFERASTVAHEWSHLAGYAVESEANFLGWLVCMRGPEWARYSGWLSLYGAVMNALPRRDRDEIAASLAQGPRDDLRAIAARIESQASPAASRAGYAVYDRYLKANRVEAGIHSYSEVVRLLLGTRFREDGTPMRRE